MPSKRYGVRNKPRPYARRHTARQVAARAQKSNVKVAKKAMVKSRARIVETKSRIQNEIITQGGGTIPDPTNFKALSGVFSFLPLHAWTFMEQGLAEDQMIGQSVFSKYLNAKVQVRMQGGANQITDRPFPMELICGFVQAPTNWTSFTSPTVNLALPSDMDAYVVARVSEYFNARKDKLAFIPKRASTIRITYRRRLEADQSKNNVLNPEAGVTNYEGHAPDIWCYPKWKMMRKINYERGNTVEAGSARPNFYPNYNQIPFMIIFAPNFDGPNGNSPIQPQETPQYAYNVSHYFTDS